MRPVLLVLLLAACDASAAPAGLREVARWAEPGPGHDPARTPLTGGGWIQDATIFDRDAKVVFSGHAWGTRYGRFGSAKAFAASPDGRVVIVDGADSPSACLCDRERGTSGSSAGALVRIAFVEGRAVERVLIEHGDRRDFAVAASASAVAAVDGNRLAVWPAAGDGAPVAATITGTTLRTLAWAGDRYLVATRYFDLDRTDVVVLDRDAGWAARWTWPVEGTIRGLAVRPGGGELAIATTRYRATNVVHVDERRVAVFGLDGALRARRDTDGHPAAVAWSARGDTLLVSTGGSKPGEVAVIRYRVPW